MVTNNYQHVKVTHCIASSGRIVPYPATGKILYNIKRSVKDIKVAKIGAVYQMTSLFWTLPPLVVFIFNRGWDTGPKYLYFKIIFT